jgi:hypothetical protein
MRSGRERDLPFAPGFFTDQALLFTGAKIACDQIPDNGKAKGGNFCFSDSVIVKSSCFWGFWLDQLPACPL